LLAPPAARSQTRLEAFFVRIEAGDPALESYRASLDFSVGLHSFPFLHKTVRGTTYYKRPGRTELVLEKLPGYLHGLISEHLFISLGPPQSWTAQFDVGLVGEEGRDEHIRLTPKMARTRIREVAIYLDEASGLPSKIVWLYTNGSIVMNQTVGKVEGHYVVVGADADMHYPAVHAYMHTKVHDFVWNVPVDDAIFTEPVLLNP
jgi:hypothetical protein